MGCTLDIIGGMLHPFAPEALAAASGGMPGSHRRALPFSAARLSSWAELQGDPLVLTLELLALGCMALQYLAGGAIRVSD